MQFCILVQDKLKIEPSNIFLLNHIVVYINNCSYKRQGILFKPNKAIEIKYKEQDVCVNHVFTKKLIELIDKLKSNIFLIRITKHPNFF
jgi:hypothetical protein